MTRLNFSSLAAVLLLLACACTNLYTGFSNEVSDASLLAQAQIDSDNGDYTDAITLFPKMSTAYQADPQVIQLWASTYAGLAGLNFLTFVNNLANNIGTTNLLLFDMQSFDSGTAATMADALAGQNKLLSITTSPALMTNDELTLLAVIGLTNMGDILSRYADPTSTGSVTAGFNPCTGIPSAAAPNDAAQEFGVSLNWVLAAVSQLSTNGTSFGPAAIGDVTAACTALSGSPPTASYSFCGVTDPTAFTANQIKGLLSLINEKTAGIGLGTCNGDIVTCACP